MILLLLTVITDGADNPYTGAWIQRAVSITLSLTKIQINDAAPLSTHYTGGVCASGRA